MAATGPTPNLRDFLGAYGDAIRGGRSTTADVRTGSGYDLAGGVSAIVWSRQSQRDRRLFQNVYTDTATGEDLDRLVLAKYQVERVGATYGAGTLTLTRPTVGSTVGRVYAGTRVEFRGGATPVPYVVAADTDIPASALAFPLPIRPTRTGPGTAIVADGSNLRLTDPIFDTTFVPTALVCGNGTDEETPRDYVARARASKIDRRNGYSTRIIARLKEAGADQVVLLDAHSLGDDNDFGLSYVYVGDSGFSADAALIKAATIAMDDVSVAGTDVQVLGMTPVSVAASVNVALISDPGGWDTGDLKRGIVASLVEEFGRRKAWWAFRTDSLGGIVQRTSSVIQTATVTTTPPEPSVSFPSQLPRYTLAASAISITVTGPT